MVLSIHRAIKILKLETGMECTRGRSLLRYSFEMDVKMLLKISREKNVRRIIESSLFARILPSSEISLK